MSKNKDAIALGFDVTIAPSRSNRTCKFPCIRLMVTSGFVCLCCCPVMDYVARSMYHCQVLEPVVCVVLVLMM